MSHLPAGLAANVIVLTVMLCLCASCQVADGPQMGADAELTTLCRRLYRPWAAFRETRRAGGAA